MGKRKGWAAVLLGALAYAVGGTTAAESPDISTDEGLTLSAIVDMAAQRDPRRMLPMAAARRGNAFARQGESLLGDSPAVSAQHYGDGATDSNGVSEWEVALELPLWRPGERGATRELARRWEVLAQERRSAFRYAVAGLVRERLWRLIIGEEQTALALQRWETAAALERDIAKRVDAGDLSRADRLLAQDEALAKRDEYLAALGEQRRAEAAYRQATGLDRRPADFAEPRSRLAAIGDDHPLLAMASAEVQRAAADLRRIESGRGAAAALTVGARREKAGRGIDWGSSVGIGFRLPFATGVHHAPAVAEAGSVLTEAEQASAAQRRDLELRLAEARARLQTIAAELELAKKQQRNAAENLRMVRVAFEVGEVDLADLLRVQTRAFNAERNLRLRRLERQFAVAQYNQAVGETP